MRRFVVNCENPRYVRNKYTSERVVARCGKCDACQNSRHFRYVEEMQKATKLCKYTIFFTLTYNQRCVPKLIFSDDRRFLFDPSLSSSGSKFKKPVVVDVQDLHLDEYDRNWLSKKHYVEYPRFSDGIEFIKRLRVNVQRSMPLEECVKQFNKYGNYEKISYFLASEVGPYSQRCHFHGLLFFNSDWLAQNFEPLFYKSWACYNRRTKRFISKGLRSEWRFDNGRSAAYTAAYCCGNTDVHPVFECRQTKARCSKSIRLSSLGSFPRREELSQYFYTPAIRRFDGLNRQGLPRPFFLSPSVESYVFPKCPRFREFSAFERRKFAFIPHSFERVFNGERRFTKFSREEVLNYSYEQFSSLIKFYINSLPSKFYWYVKSQFKDSSTPLFQWFVFYRHFWRLVDELEQSPSFVFDMIDDYYSAKEYRAMTNDYEFIEESSKTTKYVDLYSLHIGSPLFNLSNLENSKFHKMMSNDAHMIMQKGKKSKKDRDYKLSFNAVPYEKFYK